MKNMVVSIVIIVSLPEGRLIDHGIILNLPSGKLT